MGVGTKRAYVLTSVFLGAGIGHLLLYRSSISQNTENAWALGEFKGLTGLASTVGIKFLLRVFISVICVFRNFQNITRKIFL